MSAKINKEKHPEVDSVILQGKDVTNSKLRKRSGWNNQNEHRSSVIDEVTGLGNDDSARGINDHGDEDSRNRYRLVQILIAIVIVEILISGIILILNDGNVDNIIGWLLVLSALPLGGLAYARLSSYHEKNKRKE